MNLPTQTTDGGGWDLPSPSYQNYFTETVVSYFSLTSDRKELLHKYTGRYLSPFSFAVELLAQYDGTKGDFGDLLSEPVGFRLWRKHDQDPQE